MVTPSSTPQARALSAAPEIDARVGMSRPWTHYFELSMTVSGIIQENLDFVMPVWTPGSYLIREFSRHVRGFSATDETGNKLNWEKINKNTWRVHSGRNRVVEVKYRVYAYEQSVRTSFLDDSHGYINGASIFMYVDGHPEHPYRVHIDPHPGWTQISTGLDPLPGRTNSFFAPDFDTLVDSPIEIGNQMVRGFTFRDVPHFISLYGDGNHDPEKLSQDIQRIVEAAVEVFGEIPYSHYTFLIQLLPEGGGGLEHGNSASLHVSRWTFQPEESYRKFLGLVAHEFFHLWNIKRIRPQELATVDYTRENYTRSLWFSEGITEYFGNQIVLRAGLIGPDQYLENLSRTIEGFRETPGRLVDSAADASFDAWIKHYLRDENSPNSTVSYYTKGELIGLVMDLEVRRRTGGKRSLDDLMRLLYERYCKELRRGFTELELRNACEEAAGGTMEEIFERYVYGAEEMDLARYLGYAGLKLTGPDKSEKSPPKGFLGVMAKNAEGKILISAISADTPAYDQGLNVYDEIIGLDGFRVNPDSVAARIEEKAPGTRVEITISRAEKLRTIPVVLAEKKAAETKITRVSEPSGEQKQLYESWLRVPWDQVEEAVR